jgi:hypothetical protein
MGGFRRGIPSQIGAVTVSAASGGPRSWSAVDRAGLAIVWHLTRLGLRLVVMDASDRASDSWRFR